MAALGYYDLPAQEEAIQLLCMIAAHESGRFMFVRQKNGPALSLFQMEPKTFADVQAYAIHRDLKIASELPCPPERLIFDQLFSAAISRIFFLRFPESLPKTFEEMAVYAKQKWNTALGKATVDDYLRAYKRDFSYGQ